MDVWILWGPEPVTARGEDRVEAVTIGKHGLQIARGHARGLLLPGVAVEHQLDAWAFLQQVCIKAGLPTDAWKDDQTHLRVFEGQAIHGRVQAEASPRFGPPAAAGSFYPGDPAARMLDNAGRVEKSELLAVPTEHRSGERLPTAAGAGRQPWFRMPVGCIRAGWRRPCSVAWQFPPR